MNFSGLVARAKALPVREVRPASRLLLTLDNLGWQRSVRSQESIDARGAPLPWWTYATSRWLDLALRPHHRVFEFGSGNSTLWLAARVESVLSVEHDFAWEKRVRPGLPSNAALVLVDSYAGTDADVVDDSPYLEPMRAQVEPFDFVVIDGMGRNACARLAVDHVADVGMILLDDSDRVAYRPAHQALEAAGFGRLDFYGPRPGVGHLSTTSLFCRDFGAWARGLDPPLVSGH